MTLALSPPAAFPWWVERRRSRRSRRSRPRSADTAPLRPEPGGHLPVLAETVVRFLDPQPGRRFVDGTFGRGGHARALLRACPGAEVLGLDKDPEASRAAAELAAREPRFRFLRRDFAELGGALDQVGWHRADGLLLDLGLSSPQLDTPERGFSLRSPGPLDMRFDPDSGETAADLLDRLGEREIADLLHATGERRSRAIARRIVARRPIRSTRELRGAVIAAVGPRRGRLDPATRTFLAIRAAVNREPEALAAALREGPERLAPGGAMVVIAYHSGEDRPVKHHFRALAREERFELGAKKPVRPDPEERRRNPRSRSARLRVLFRVPRGGTAPSPAAAGGETS